jgi:hypothetical protein
LIAVNHATTLGITIHSVPITAIRALIAVTNKNIFLAYSGFSFAQLVIFSKYGITAFTASVSLSKRPPSITSQFEKPHKDASVTPTLSLNVLITPLKVALFLSIIWKNKPHALVASIIVFFTMSNVMSQSSIFSRNEAILSPVLSDIFFNGLNHKLIICNKSCHVNFPALDTWPYTKARLFNLFALPHDISHNIIMSFITVSCATPNCNIVLVACTRSEDSNGVFAAAF